MKYTINIILGIWVLCLICRIVDVECFNRKYYNKIKYPSDCTFQTPSGFKIMYNSQTKKYVVADLTWGDYYLYTRSRRIYAIFSHIAKPCVFDDSCEAKGYLKAYIEQGQPKIKGYK